MPDKRKAARGLLFALLLVAANVAAGFAFAQDAEARHPKQCSGAGEGAECLHNGLFETCTTGSECRGED